MLYLPLGGFQGNYAVQLCVSTFVCSCHTGRNQLTLKDLNNVMRREAARVATRWYDLGVELLDSNTAVLDVIQSDHQSDNARCSKMFKAWLETKPDASWSQLVTALDNIGLKTAAEKVQISKLSKEG